MMLPDSLLSRPIAHRGLHDLDHGRPENSRAAIRAAMVSGYPIEIDLQLSRDKQAIVFHDYDMRRLVGQPGPVQLRSSEELAQITLLGGDETVPTLPEVLNLVAGQVPLLIELKDQEGGLGSGDGALERATAKALEGYSGDVALMSFNPHMVAELAQVAPDRPRGLTTCSFNRDDWQTVKQERLEELRSLPDVDRVGACFISHNVDDLGSRHVTKRHEAGFPILCWTVRSAQQEAEARKVADNVTFEGYTA